jgi:hypothetical protein
VLLFAFAVYRASSRKTILRVFRRSPAFVPRMTTVIASNKNGVTDGKAEAFEDKP